jgi:pimeloyl-ACP methyl ester carboxylesterase
MAQIAAGGEQRKGDGMNVVFVHGWSTTNTDTYGYLPEWLAKQQGFKVSNICLGKYISFVDTVTLDDIARAMDAALREELGDQPKPFACVTHSTGGPVARLWLKMYYEGNLADCPMKHLIILAPANHGSTLAQLGKSTLGHIKATFGGVEPGVRVLDWLELGSDGAWKLNEAWLDYDCVAAGIFTFVLTGQSIDRKMYDHVNSYTGEPGSDGVVRVAAANMNYGLIRLHQRGDGLEQMQIQRAPKTAFGVLTGLAHGGDKMGIMKSVTKTNADTHQTTKWLLKCLMVSDAADYAAVSNELDQLTRDTQENEHEEKVKTLFGPKTYTTDRYAMVVFRMVDDRGETLSDYDLLITGGPKYSPDALPSGFFVDRQRNRKNVGKLTYYLNSDVLLEGLNNAQAGGHIGFRLVARPEKGPKELMFYHPLDWKSDKIAAAKILRPNETLMVEIRLERRVDARVFRLGRKLKPSKISKTPMGHTVS